MQWQRNRDVEYFPHNRYTGRLKDISGQRNGLIYFIYNPWFEPVFPEDKYRKPDNTDVTHMYFPRSSYISNGAGPYWFGNNSVRGVLAETVAKLLEEAKLPSTEPAQAPWFQKKTMGRKTDLGQVELRKWTMEEFISTTISSEDGWACSGIDEECAILKEFHITPRVEWEILHPQLPILKITAHADQTLPLAPAGLERISENDVLRDRWQISNMSTKYSVSFVISLQNRWASFNDPNRWIIRFKDNLYRTKPWELDPELPYPNYWDDTGYMQHRIIGPVVLTVHNTGRRERSTSEDTRPPARQLQPGTKHHPLGGPRTHPDRRAEADLRCTQDVRYRIQTDGLRGMAEPEYTQRRVPAAGACAHGAQAGTGNGGVEEVRDGGLRLVGCH